MVSLNSIGNWGAGFLRSQLSEKDGTVSNTKVIILQVFVCVLTWITCLLYKLHVAITMTDIVTFMGEAKSFIVTVLTPLAGIKAIADVANNHAPNAGPQIIPPPTPSVTP